ncbi:bifunctional folylpolyglutamate synthase/dihydrofolate synthase [Clostridium tetanomorphum]|uniref:tetrahydrofolate synthase n=1 Tax=Clostridium tetanomorphum TaxID=1553 RepID=A0A923J0Z5_CLOTT|nr:folylpolyglutamate synthase/dihydrofolate synthase family protein [Clostridium tetanomorphum]MBC2398244.1 bifunctional folylpolyglutamate synthase/dihydrofolate synthase [Clostridium tetanomorphum]NRZ96135.1 dihydrofolate synthase/folylpolyglutamate synthase [Clostridium tetanomorphum]
MNYNEAMAYIENTAKFGSNLGTERTEKILELLGNPHKQLKCIHIAGTNGKGSTTTMITKILMEAGFKVGMYTSPFIEEFEERMQINGENIPKCDLAKIVTKVSEAVERVIELGYEHPTEFEIITCAMFLYYYESKVDYAVIEVGLGGRMDSTNVITPLVSVITSISYDHMQILGDTLGKIAFEKGGIIKEKVPVVLYPQKKEAEEVIKKICEEKSSHLTLVSEDSVKYINKDLPNEYYQNFTVKTENNEYEVQLSLLGTHQILNCSVVLHTIDQLIKQGINIKKEHIYKALKEVKWAGRLEIMSKNPLVVLDGAHNIDGITNLKNSVERYFKYNKMVLILGILADKQVEDMVRTITPMAYKVIAVTPHSYRAENSNILVEVIKKHNKNCESIDDYEEAYKKALSYCNEDDLVLISGSLYMIGDMRKIVRKLL